MDAVEKLASAIKMVEEARGVPLSASCVVHRGEMLGVLDEAKAALPESFAKAESIVANRDKVIDEGRMQAEQMVAMAREEASQLIEQTAIMQQAREEAKNILAQARQEAAEQKQEIEEYIDLQL
jgi:dsDNA-specific endonuclease/ATPase MutS2